MHLRNVISGCVLGVVVSAGLNVLCPDYSSAAEVYTFSYDGSNIYSGLGNTVDGSFSIPVSDFTGSTSNGSTITLPNTDILALDFTVVYTANPPSPSGSFTLGLADVNTTPDPSTPSITFTFEGGLPQVTTGSGGFIAQNSSGGFGLTCCGADVSYPGLYGPTYTDDGGTWVTTTADISTTPLPGTWTMLIAGLAGLGFVACRGSKKRSIALSCSG